MSIFVSGASLRRGLGRLLLACGLIWALAGCQEQEQAAALAKQGADTATLLQSYYESLAADALDTWEMQVFQDAIAGGAPSSDAAQKQLEQTAKRQRELLDHLRKRGALAKALNGTYATLAALADGAPADSIKASTRNFVDEAAGAARSNDTWGAQNGLIALAAQDLAGLFQAKAIREANEGMLRSLKKIESLFQAELAAYKSLARVRQNELVTAFDVLVDKELVIASGLIDRPVQYLGLEWPARSKPIADKAMQAGVKAIARARSERSYQASADAADALLGALGDLRAAHENLAAGKISDLPRLKAALERAKAYLDELESIRKSRNS